MISSNLFLQDKNEKCVFEITMHNDIAFKLLSEMDFHHLDMTQLNFNNVKKIKRWNNFLKKKKNIAWFYQQKISDPNFFVEGAWIVS